MRFLYFAGYTYAVVAAFLWLGGQAERGPTPISVTPAPVTTDPGPAEVAWFREIRSHCNPVEVETRHRWTPPPATELGVSYSAACYALAGKVDRARELIDELPAADRWQAAGVVFNAGHPIADAGDDEAAGPIMELVVEYWPNHYMALYHAGMSRYLLGDHEAARVHLEGFLRNYESEDGWTSNARTVLEGIDAS